MFDTGEQKILDNLPKAIDSVKTRMGNVGQVSRSVTTNLVDFSSIDSVNESENSFDGEGRSNSFVRVRTDGNPFSSKRYEDADYGDQYHFNGVSDNSYYNGLENKNSGNVTMSFALVAVAVTIGVLNIIGYRI